MPVSKPIPNGVSALQYSGLGLVIYGLITHYANFSEKATWSEDPSWQKAIHDKAVNTLRNPHLHGNWEFPDSETIENFSSIILKLWEHDPKVVLSYTSVWSDYLPGGGLYQEGTQPEVDVHMEVIERLLDEDEIRLLVVAIDELGRTAEPEHEDLVLSLM